MIVKEHVPLSSLTTFKTGGAARYVITASTTELADAVSFAREKGLPWRVLGEGSNVLASDAGYEGVIIRITSSQVTFSDTDEGVLAICDAGVSWDSFVSLAAAQGLWGVENLAGIPGTVGAAPIQNIGAYGSEVKDTILWVEVFDPERSEVRRMSADECVFSYRDSAFKKEPYLVVIRVAFLLSRTQGPLLSYKDLQDAVARGEVLKTPTDIALCVRRIRAGKFPDLTLYGTAGSFFKNPILTEEKANTLRAAYPELPVFAYTDGFVKIPLAWILDKALSLKGFSVGKARAFEQQPLVLVAEQGATTNDVNVCADAIAARVYDATDIFIEREVQSLA